jgi:hypothetical protein
MSDEPVYRQGDRVRFTAEQLGTIDPAADRPGFAELMVNRGELGTVAVQPGVMPDGWLAVTPDADERLYVPVHPSMIEPAPEARGESGRDG